jgi:hypothetical protein
MADQVGKKYLKKMDMNKSLYFMNYQWSKTNAKLCKII